MCPEVTPNNENANDLVQSHELELQHSFTEWWLVQLTVGLEQPLHEDFEASDVEFETEFALIKRRVTASPCRFRVDMRSPRLAKRMSSLHGPRPFAVIPEALETAAEWEATFKPKTEH